MKKIIIFFALFFCSIQVDSATLVFNQILSIKISIKSVDGIIDIIIRDSGPGFIKENVKEGSLGLKLINIMCTQLEAVHDIKSDKGVTHKIKFSFVKP